MLQDMGVYIDEPWSMNPSWKLIVAGQSVSKFDVCQYVKKKNNFWDLKWTTLNPVVAHWYGIQTWFLFHSHLFDFVQYKAPWLHSISLSLIQYIIQRVLLHIWPSLTGLKSHQHTSIREFDTFETKIAVGVEVDACQWAVSLAYSETCWGWAHFGADLQAGAAFCPHS